MKNHEVYVPIWEKFILTIREASLYFNIGQNKISELLDIPDCPFVLRRGTKKLVKREEFEKYIQKTDCI